MAVERQPVLLDTAARRRMSTVDFLASEQHGATL
jgi:hypothetical protein